MEVPPHTNRLIRETSPYLLQHAHNPVHWYPWGEEALKRARDEDKLIVVSIGYSSCHWCHVMEEESFEDPEVARLMNEHFVSIKVDREERPDLDQLYMAAVQLMNQRGGWPLNCIALPDGRPVWGGTYFPRENWMAALQEVADYYRYHREETLSYAKDLEQGIRHQALIDPPQGKGSLEKGDLDRAVEQWSSLFDHEFGGTGGAPKFPMPLQLEFLLHYGIQNHHKQILDHVDRTLTRMARGGIYDQVGGGFARYSVDAQWKVPHFEKMLYDNAQLIGLYASAFQVFRKPLYEEVIRQSIEWLSREMVSKEGAFYCSLDADSEGEEGKYYVWEQGELASLLGEEAELFSEYYHIGPDSRWEGPGHILRPSLEPEAFAEKHRLELNTCYQMIRRWKALLLERRMKRVPPGLDDKSLTSWNSLMISGLVKAFRALGEKEYLTMALRSASLIMKVCREEDHTLYRNYRIGTRSIPGFLIDYALCTEACLDLYEVTMEVQWLDHARNLLTVTLERFYDRDTGMFRFIGSNSNVPITNPMEVQDQVIPSSNSVMALNLFRMGHLLARNDFIETSARMVHTIQEKFIRFPHGFANWGRLIIKQLYPYYEVVVTGPETPGLLTSILKDYHPNILVAGTEHSSDLPLFRQRSHPGKSLIFVCRDQVCQLPLTDPQDAKNLFHPGKAT
jgi:uncharacterized protein YyaL (SSP411 family)